MTRKKQDATGKDFQDVLEEELRTSSRKRYVLRLYVAGITPRSRIAIENIKKICEENLQGRYDLEVIDIFQQPELARREQIIAAPTLIKKLPLPLRKIIGDMADTNRIVVGLDLELKE